MPKPFNRIFGKNPGVNIQREFYTMSTIVDSDEAEIIMYGYIVQETPRDWWTNEPLEGNYIVLSEFIDDLNELANVKRITIRLNSGGGDAFAAIPIHNRLRELKAEVTVIVDGIAMSGGALIMCAADKVRVNPSSLIMIHKCWGIAIGTFDADSLRKIATEYDAVDKAQAAIYKRKTGIDEADLLSMMADETYMTGGEAVEKGFADELTEDKPVQIAASADRQTIFVNGSVRRLPFPLTGLPENIPTVNAEEGKPALDSTNKNQPAASGNTEGGKPMPQTLEELRKESPEAAEKLMAEAREKVSAEAGDATKAAAEEERKRLMEIDEVSGLFDDETVREAKYGEQACTAQEMSYRAAQKAAKEGKQFMSNLTEDAKQSGAQDVGAAPGETNELGKAQGSNAKVDAEAAGKQAAAMYNKVIGGKKDE